MTHHLKTWPTYYDAVERGEKTFEGRRNDRNFQSGDIVVLCRTVVDGSGECKTAAPTLTRRIGFVLHGGQFGIAEGWCVFSLLDEGAPGDPAQAGSGKGAA